jgi:hypothetical protein
VFAGLHIKPGLPSSKENEASFPVLQEKRTRFLYAYSSVLYYSMPEKLEAEPWDQQAE